MIDDFVRQRGYLTLGTRLKRIGERLQADVQQLMDATNVPIQAGQYPLLAALEANGPLTVGELVDALGVSQPGITRSVGQLAKQGVVTVKRGATDQRTKVVTLTDRGLTLVVAGKEGLWPHIDDCLADICDGQQAPLLDQLDRLEDALRERSLFHRIMKPEKA